MFRGVGIDVSVHSSQNIVSSLSAMTYRRPLRVAMLDLWPLLGFILSRVPVLMF